MIKITNKEREQVKALAGYGLTDLDIANVLGFSEATLQRRCGEELKKGRSLAKSAVTQTAYKMAVSGKVPAMTMFWLKTRCGWKEITVNELVGKDGQAIKMEKEKFDLSSLNADELKLFKKLTEKIAAKKD